MTAYANVKYPGMSGSQVLDEAQRRVRTLASRGYVDYPRVVGIETLAVCNASCGFCPYPTLERKGDRMSDDLYAKILDDLTAIPGSIPFDINLSRVNEPFLDKRIFTLSRAALDRLPNASLRYFTNASALNDANLDRLFELDRITSVNVSLNDHRPAEYAATMGLPFERTVRNLDALHSRLAVADRPFLLRVSRVCDGTPADQEYKRWVEGRWPLAQVFLRPRADWLGRVESSTLQPYQPKSILDAPCVQWFCLQVLASGQEAFCNWDSDGRHGRMNAKDAHMLDIYNQPHKREKRERLDGRLAFEVCRGCDQMD